MKKSIISAENILLVLFLACLGLMLTLYVQKYDNSILWKVTSQAEVEEIPGFSFSKGPFEFSLPGHRISIVESFNAGPIERNFETERALLVLTFIGLAMLLAASTLLTGFWYYALSGLFIFFFIFLDLNAVQFLGFQTFSKWGTVILIAAFMIPSYLFNAFFKETHFLIRLGCFLIIGALLIFFSGVDPILLQEQMAIGAYAGLAIITVFFLFIIAEENVFGLLYLITKTRGGQNNEKHFTLFGLVYLGIVGLAYANKAGFIHLESNFFDPYVLLTISSLVALWSISYKSALFEKYIAITQTRIILIALGITTFSFLSYNFYRGNDAYFESFHYLIIYTHLGFGALFFLYIISNFINPLIGGLQIYKIAYKSRNLPYSTTRIAGFIAVLAFFFLSDKEPYQLLQGGKYNFLGAKAEIEQQPKLALDYYKKGRAYAFDNHFSSYTLGYKDLQKAKYQEANKLFGRATLRFPSAQSFVNTSSTYSLNGEVTPSLITLKKGLIEFPNEPHLLNNLGLTYLDLNEVDSARKYLAKSTSTSSTANKVNYWRTIPLDLSDSLEIIDIFQNANVPIKANILSKLLQAGGNIQSLAYEEPQNTFQLHKIAYLTNAAFYFNKDTIISNLKALLQSPIDASLYETVSHDLAILEVKRGNIKTVLYTLDLLQSQANREQKGTILNELGLIALSQHAPTLADDFFEKAISYGNKPAKFNQVIAALEMSMEEKAKSLTKQLLAEDSSLIGFYKDLLSMERIAADTPNVLNIYYNYREYTMAELSVVFDNMDVNFAQSWLDKIFREQFDNEAELNRYLDLFKGKLDISPYRRILDKKLTPAESKVALTNPLNAPRYLAALEQIKSKEEAYNEIAVAIDMNPFDTLLLTAYIFKAQDLGLRDFAATGLQRLQGLVDQERYSKVKKQLEALDKSNTSKW